MTEKEIIKLLTRVIDGRRGVSIKCTGKGTYRLYDRTNAYTAMIISDAFRLAADYFTGISVDCNGRAYMLFYF